METNRKQRRGRKLIMNFYRAAQPSSTVQFSSAQVKPTPSSATVGFRVDHPDFSIPSPKQKKTFVKPDSVRDHHSINGHLNSLCSGGGDENVDMKAASYISFVQERFRNEEQA